MNLKERITEDYFKKDRLPAYKKTLEVARKLGYQMVGMLDFVRIVRDGELTGRRIYLNRHDIDTSPKVAAEMFAIEKDVYGKTGTATYYFRTTTINRRLIEEIDNYGYETGYHYEELATYAKMHRLKSREAIEGSINEAGKMFLSNLGKFREITGSKSLTVASHGDFINTRYNIQSYEILQDASIRSRAKIVAEAYDSDVMQYVQKRIADQTLLTAYADTVIEAFEEGCPVVMTLTHPRNWKVDIQANTLENWRRLKQDFLFTIRN